MVWLEFVPVLLVTAAVLAVPGLALGLALRLRGIWLIAAAAPLTVSIVSVAAVVSPWVGLRWGPLPVLAMTILAVGSALAWARWVAPAPRTFPRRGFATAFGLTLGALTIGFILVRGIGDPEWISQRFDNFFHLNAIEYVIDTGNASPLWVGSMTSPGGLPFYPSGWHALGSLIVELTGASAAVTTNAMIIVIAAIVWPLGAILLARTVLGSRPEIVVGAGVLAAAFPAYPYLPLHYGVLYPLFLGLACVPVALSAAYRLLRPHSARRTRPNWALLVILLAPGMALAHPGSLLAFLALSVPFVVGLVIHRIAASPRRGQRWLWALALVAYFVAALIVLWVVRPPLSQIYWPVLERLPQAIGEVVSAAVFEYPVAIIVAIMIAIGTYTAVRRPTYPRWIVLGMGAVGAILYIVVAGSPSETLRMWLTAPWYNNSPRLASIWAIGGLALAVLGFGTVTRFVARRLRDLRTARWVREHPNAGLAAIGVLLLVLTQGAAIRQAAADIEFTYQLRDGGPILTPDEFALMKEISQIVPEGVVVAGNPWTGASFAYGISGRRVLMPHLLMDETAAAHVINTEFDSAGDSARVCRALADTGVGYILDFGHEEFMDNDGDYSGIDDLSGSPYVELAAQEGNTRLYRIVSCGLGGGSR